LDSIAPPRRSGLRTASRRTRFRRLRRSGIADNPAIITDWPLSRDQAGAIAGLIGIKINAGNYDWALESDTVPDRVNVERAARPVPPKIGEKPKR
jgi:hypothetical protein